MTIAVVWVQVPSSAFIDSPKVLRRALPGFCRFLGNNKKCLARKLAILDEKGSKAVILEEFEHLEYDKIDLYSIRYPKSKNNPRVIYFLIEDDNVILVTAFKEKSNKDYRQGIERAVKRYKMMM